MPPTRYLTPSLSSSPALLSVPVKSGSGDARAKEEVRTALQGVSEWFDDYLGGEQGDGLEQVCTQKESDRRMVPRERATACFSLVSCLTYHAACGSLESPSILQADRHVFRRPRRNRSCTSRCCCCWREPGTIRQVHVHFTPGGCFRGADRRQSRVQKIRGAPRETGSVTLFSNNWWIPDHKLIQHPLHAFRFRINFQSWGLEPDLSVDS